MDELNVALNTVAGLENSEEIMLHFWHVIGKEDSSLYAERIAEARL